MKLQVDFQAILKHPSAVYANQDLASILQS